jgi:hypothetical protein
MRRCSRVQWTAAMHRRPTPTSLRSVLPLDALLVAPGSVATSGQSSYAPTSIAAPAAMCHNWLTQNMQLQLLLLPKEIEAIGLERVVMVMAPTPHLTGKAPGKIVIDRRATRQMHRFLRITRAQSIVAQGRMVMGLVRRQHFTLNASRQ